jgi:phosphoribosylanthranilate isomerase
MLSERGRPKVKICGITTVADARRAVELGADFIGLNFYSGSPRYIEPQAAGKIARAVDGDARIVGVFAGSSAEEIRRIDRQVELDLLQFHGRESAEEIAPFKERALRVLWVGEDLPVNALESSESCWGVLLDTQHREMLGGTGKSWGWSLARPLSTRRHLFVAGGISPQNALSAARDSQAWAIDVCSGVESAPGRKDWDKMERLFTILNCGDDS